MFDFSFHYILENENVRLTPLQESDYEHLLEFALQEPELWEYSLIQANSPELLKNYIDEALKDRANQKSYPFVVYNKRTNKYAGSTRFYEIQLKHFTLLLGYTWYGKEFQGTGLNVNCKYLMLQFAFEKMNMERVEFRADSQNKRSIQAMKKIGCVEEGTLRSHLKKPDGSRRNSIILSILKGDWFSVIKDDLQKKTHPFNNPINP